MALSALEQPSATSRNSRFLARIVIVMKPQGEKVIPPSGITRIHAEAPVIVVLKPGTESLVDQVLGRKTR